MLNERRDYKRCITIITHVWLTSHMKTLGKKTPIFYFQGSLQFFMFIAFHDTAWSTILCTASWCIVLFGHWAQPKGDRGIWESEHHWFSSADYQGSSQYSKYQYICVLLILWYTKYCKYFDGSRTIDTSTYKYFSPLRTACTTHNRSLRVSILLKLIISRWDTCYIEHYSVHRN